MQTKRTVADQLRGHADMKVAIVTGSNKGIGFAIVKGLLKRFKGVVFLTARDNERGMSAVAELDKLGLHPKYHYLDVANRDSVVKFRDHIRDTYGGIDILVNNAAVAHGVELYNPHEINENIININFFSVLTIQELLFPLVRDNGRILNISSNCGNLSNIRNKYWIERLSSKSLSVNDIKEFVNWYLESSKSGTFKKEDIADNGTLAALRVSKVALSALTILQQKELACRNIAVNSMHPGLVKTDMTKGVGFFDADQAAETPLYLLLDAPQDLKGAFVWYDRRILDWYDANADYYFKCKTLLQTY